MFPAEKSAMSSAVLLLSSVISAIPHLPRSLRTPVGDVRSPYVYRRPYTRMPHIPLMERHSGSSACGVTPQDASGAAYHTRTPERVPYREGKRGVPWLHTTSRRTGLARHGLDTFSLDNPANRRDNGRKLELSLQAMRPLATWRTLM